MLYDPHDLLVAEVYLTSIQEQPKIGYPLQRLENRLSQTHRLAVGIASRKALCPLPMRPGRGNISLLSRMRKTNRLMTKPR